MDKELVKADKKVITEIFADALQNSDFRNWLQYSYRKIRRIRDDKYRFAWNISEITFAVHQYPNGEVAKKIAIGLFGEFFDDNKDWKYFLQLVKKHCPKAESVFSKFSPKDLYGVGIGVEYSSNRWIWKFYVATNQGKMIGVNCENGRILEVKEYDLDEKVVKVKGKHKRIQFNIEADGVEAFKAIKLLKEKGHLNDKAYKIAEAIVLRDMALDTISVSPTRGIALYFE